MAPSPRVPPVVGPAVTVALARLKFPVAVVAVGTAAAGTVAGTVVFCVTWPAGLLPDQGVQGQSWPQMRRQPQVHRARR